MTSSRDASLYPTIAARSVDSLIGFISPVVFSAGNSSFAAFFAIVIWLDEFRKLSNRIRFFNVCNRIMTSMFERDRKITNLAELQTCKNYQITPNGPGIFFGGASGTLVNVSQNCWPLVEAFSLKSFQDISTNTTQKITFYCIFINKFPKNFQKKC